MHDNNFSEHNDIRHSLPVRRREDQDHRSLDVRRPRRRNTSQQSNADGLSPAVLLRIFQQWWKWVLPLGVLISVAAGLIVMKTHVLEYEASAIIKIEGTEPYIAFSTDAIQQSGGRYIATQVALIRSDMNLERVMAQAAIANLAEFRDSSDPVKDLKDKLQVQQIEKSELYAISYTSESPEAAAEVTQAVVREYLTMQADEEFQKSQRVIALLEKEKGNRDKEITSLRERVVNLATELSGRDPFNQSVVVDVEQAFNPAASLYQKNITSDVQIALLKAEIQTLQEMPVIAPADADPLGLIAIEVESSDEVKGIKSQIAQLKEQTKLFKDKYVNWETNSDYLALLAKTDEASAELDSIIAETTAKVIELRQKQSEQKNKEIIKEKQKQLDKLNLQRELWAEEYNASMEALKANGGQSINLEFAKAELARAERVQEAIAARLLALKTEIYAPPRVTSLKRASVPTSPVELIPLKLLLVACSASLALPFGLVLLKELMAKKIVGVEQLHQVSHLPILGEIAKFPVRPVAEGPRSLPRRQQREMLIFAESIDSLRTNLVLTENLGAEGKSHVIAVSSAASGEGKTSVATSLAVSLSGSTKKPTLVVDADLRSPDVANVLGVHEGPGLYEVLAGKTPLSEAIVRIGETNTFVLPAGRNKGNPHHVIDGAKIAMLYQSLRGKFATIVVDTPPVLGASESLIYAKEADFVVYCSLTDVSRAKQVNTAVTRLESTGAEIAGAVLSGIPSGRYAYSYGYYGDQQLP